MTTLLTKKNPIQWVDEALLNAKEGNRLLPFEENDENAQEALHYILKYDLIDFPNMKDNYHYGSETSIKNKGKEVIDAGGFGAFLDAQERTVKLNRKPEHTRMLSIKEIQEVYVTHRRAKRAELVAIVSILIAVVSLAFSFLMWRA